MSKFQTDLTMQIDNETVSSIKSGDYVEVFKITQELTAADVPVLLINNTSTTIGQSTFRSAKGLIIKNTGKVGAEVLISYDGWTDASPAESPDKTSTIDANATGTYISHLLGAGDFIYLPALRAMSWDSPNSAGNARLIDNEAPDSNMYIDSGANVDHATSATIGSDATHTTLNLENGHSKYFIVGDLIRLGNEICEVTAVGTGADLANSTLTITRGEYGSTPSTHADAAAVSFPFFNAYADFDKYSTAQTDGSGRFKAMNLFGYGRTTEAYGGGITPASFAIKFYEAGYQELGLSGITASTESGLTASTNYHFTINVDGAGTVELNFDTSSNTKFGGSDGVIRKIQDALDAAFYASGNLFEKKVHVAIVNGDIRFTSGQHLSTSSIALTAGTSGGSSAEEFFDGATGRIPASPEAAVAARLPEDTLKSKSTNLEVKNDAVFGYDDGFGNISGACTGTINYETGAIDIQGCPPNANFVITATYASAHSGGVEYTAAAGNSITGVLGRCMNHKVNTTVEIIAVR